MVDISSANIGVRLKAEGGSLDSLAEYKSYRKQRLAAKMEGQQSFPTLGEMIERRRKSTLEHLSQVQEKAFPEMGALERRRAEVIAQFNQSLQTREGGHLLSVLEEAGYFYDQDGQYILTDFKVSTTIGSIKMLNRDSVIGSSPTSDISSIPVLIKTIERMNKMNIKVNFNKLDHGFIKKDLEHLSDEEFDLLLERLSKYSFLFSQQSDTYDWEGRGKRSTSILEPLLQGGENAHDIIGGLEFAQKIFQLTGSEKLAYGSHAGIPANEDDIALLQAKLFVVETLYVHNPEKFQQALPTLEALWPLVSGQSFVLLEQVMKKGIERGIPGNFSDYLNSWYEAFTNNTESTWEQVFAVKRVSHNFVTNNSLLSQNEKQYWHAIVDAFSPIEKTFFNGLVASQEEIGTTNHDILILNALIRSRRVQHNTYRSERDISAALSLNSRLSKQVPITFLLADILPSVARGHITGRSDIQEIGDEVTQFLQTNSFQGEEGRARFLLKYIVNHGLTIGDGNLIDALRRVAEVDFEGSFKKSRGENLLGWGHQVIHNYPSPKNLPLFRAYVEFLDTGNIEHFQRIAETIPQNMELSIDTPALLKARKSLKISRKPAIEIITMLEKLYEPKFDDLLLQLRSNRVSEDGQIHIQKAFEAISHVDADPIAAWEAVAQARRFITASIESNMEMREAYPLLLVVDNKLDMMADLLLAKGVDWIEKSLRSETIDVATVQKVQNFLQSTRSFMESAGVSLPANFEGTKAIDMTFAQEQGSHLGLQRLAFATRLMRDGFWQQRKGLERLMVESIAQDLLNPEDQTELLQSVQLRDALFMCTNALSEEQLKERLQERKKAEQESDLTGEELTQQYKYEIEQLKDSTPQEEYNAALHKAAYARAAEVYGVNIYRGSSLVHVDDNLERLEIVLTRGHARSVELHHQEDVKRVTQLREQIDTMYQQQTSVSVLSAEERDFLQNHLIGVSLNVEGFTPQQLTGQLTRINMSPFARAYRYLQLAEGAKFEDVVARGKDTYLTTEVNGIPLLLIREGENFIEDPYRFLVNKYQLPKAATRLVEREGD